ncbi:MAG TPA: hypothetical protein VIW80_21560 [Pyrinomonadaceae bacterium]
MTIQWQGGQTLVNRLRVRGRGLDRALTQLRLATLLGSASLSPAGLSPSAILCVRQLRDPLPGTLALHRTTGGMTRPHAWERAVASSLAELARSAARPIRDAAPANAEAVLFADHAELLACLAADWCDSLAASRWWWKSLFRGTDAANALMPALLAAPAYVPAALEHLSLLGKAEKFAGRLSSTDARALLLSLTRSFSLPQLQAALDKAFDDADDASYHTDAGLAQGAFTQRGTEAARASVTAQPTPAPWQQYVPESLGPRLKPEQQALLGIGLLLLRAPSLARSGAFARNTQSWLRQAARDEAERASLAQASNAQDATHRSATNKMSPPEILAASSEEASPSSPVPVPPSVVIDEAIAPPSPVNVETALRATEKRAGPATIEAAGEAHQNAPAENDTIMVASSRSTEPSSQEVESRTDEHYESGPTPEAKANDESVAPDFETPRASAARVYEAYIETELGGIFYLINVALFLELYGDFTMPQEPGLSLSIWDFLTLFGAELDEKFDRDPLSALLLQLAGRAEDEALGQGFEPPQEWRIPPRWLASFPERAACEWEAGGGRLRVRHAEGFLVLDVSLDDDAARAVDAEGVRARLLHEMEAYRDGADLELRPAASSEWSQAARETDALKRWFGWLAPFVFARLRRALGLANGDALAPLLFEHAARASVTATHLDIYFGLASLPVEIRLAGIDRDPGWVPAAGRYIAFHYE